MISLTAKRTGGSIIVTLTNVSGKILSVVPPAEYTLRQKFVDEKGEVTEGGNSAIMAQAPADLAMVVEDLQPGETRTFSWLIMRMVVSGVTPEPGSSKFVAMYNGPAWSWEAVAKKHEVVGYMSRYSNPVDW